MQVTGLIKSIIFDIGNVLVDFRWRQVYESFGFQTPTATSLIPFHNPVKNPAMELPIFTKKSATDWNACLHQAQMESQFIQRAVAIAISAPMATIIMPMGFAVIAAFSAHCATVQMPWMTAHAFCTTFTAKIAIL